MRDYFWLAFVLGAALSWGCYVPTLHEGQKLLGGVPGKGAMRAFLCVGLAYFVTAVLVPGALLATGQEERIMNRAGFGFAFTAGVLGAAGALCIIFSIKFGGRPAYVAPLVFAGAPIINTLLTFSWHRPEVAPGPLFYVGICLAAMGAGLVLFEKGRVESASQAKRAAAAAVAPQSPNSTGTPPAASPSAPS